MTDNSESDNWDAAQKITEATALIQAAAIGRPREGGFEILAMIVAMMALDQGFEERHHEEFVEAFSTMLEGQLQRLYAMPRDSMTEH